MTTEPLRILVVEDNHDSAKLLEVVLTGHGHEARLAFDGREAIELAKLYQPDVVLLDLTLRGMSGIAVAAELRSIPALSTCRLVAVSGHGEEILPRPSPFDHYFQKPVNLAALVDHLSRFTTRPRPCSSRVVA
jgi:CheY-like chemotaxis protein